MSKRLLLAIFTGLLIALAMAAGCVPLPGQTGGAVSTGPAITAEPAATAVITPAAGTATTLPVAATPTFVPTVLTTTTSSLGPTAEVSTSVLPATTAPSSTPAAPTEGTPVGGRRVTLEDNGKTITLAVGERFLLYLGEGYEWEVNIADQNVVSRVIGVLTIRGSQGLFEAREAGTTTLSAAGNPACLSAQPPCAMPSQLFQVQITVSQ